jgi:hypothetical protein
MGKRKMSDHNQAKSNIVPFPVDNSLAYYMREFEEGRSFQLPVVIFLRQLWIARWFDDPRDRAAGIRVLTKVLRLDSNSARVLLDVLESNDYEGFPQDIPLPPAALKYWREIAKSVLEMPVKERTNMEAFVVMCENRQDAVVDFRALFAMHKRPTQGNKVKKADRRRQKERDRRTP